MKTIAIPYHTGSMDLHIDEKNLQAVITAKMHVGRKLVSRSIWKVAP
ncbi:MAG: hypothetical protein RR461_04855 [Angelakisella sp.]